MKKLILSILLPATMLCCQSENESVRDFQKPEYKCWYANISGGQFYGSGRSHTDDYERYDGKVIYLNESTTFNYHCYDSNKYTDEQMREIIKNKYTQ